MSKNLVLIRDVINLYHPEFVSTPALKRYALKNPEIFNVERLIEESLAAVGGYDFVNEYGRDFNDCNDSDSKTTTVISDGRSKSLTIASVENKIGSLRITIYNAFQDRVDFMYMPFSEWQKIKEPSYGKASYKERIRARWSQFNDDYNSCEHFRVGSFKELATIQG